MIDPVYSGLSYEQDLGPETPYMGFQGLGPETPKIGFQDLSPRS